MQIIKLTSLFHKKDHQRHFPPLIAAHVSENAKCILISRQCQRNALQNKAITRKWVYAAGKLFRPKVLNYKVMFFDNFFSAYRDVKQHFIIILSHKIQMSDKKYDQQFLQFKATLCREA